MLTRIPSLGLEYEVEHDHSFMVRTIGEYNPRAPLIGAFVEKVMHHLEHHGYQTLSKREAIQPGKKHTITLSCTRDETPRHRISFVSACVKAASKAENELTAERTRYQDLLRAQTPPDFPAR